MKYIKQYLSPLAFAVLLCALLCACAVRSAPGFEEAAGGTESPAATAIATPEGQAAEAPPPEPAEEAAEAFAPAAPSPEPPEETGAPSPPPKTEAPETEPPQPEMEPPEESAQPTAEPPVETALPEETPPPVETLTPEETPHPEPAPPEEAPLPEPADETADPLDALREAVAASATAEKTAQILLAVDHELTFWEKGEDGAWQLRMETYCGYGKNGLVPGEERIMGSKTTPVGAFPLTLAFGTGENPGTAMTWRQITEDSYWTEVEDERFNTWVESETPVPGEHLIDYYQYEYAVNIGFNQEDVVYSRGSAIFLHVKSINSWDTAGCVSLREEDMLALLRLLRDGAWMIIVPDAEAIAQY